MRNVMLQFRTWVTLVAMSALLLPVTSCDDFNIDDYLNNGLTEGEVAAGLRQALEVATDTSVNQASKTDGYLANAAIKILLPPEVQTVNQFINDNVPGVSGLSQTILDELVVKLNRAAENAATKATPIFVDAITGITITDAFDILQGSDTAATTYLKGATFTPLKDAFKPDIQNSLEAVGAQQVCGTLTTNYNTVASTAGLFGLSLPAMNTDLADYTTGKALDGLFHYVAQEEKEIRENPLDRVTELLQKVFGSLD